MPMLMDLEMKRNENYVTSKQTVVVVRDDHIDVISIHRMKDSYQV